MARRRYNQQEALKAEIGQLFLHHYFCHETHTAHNNRSRGAGGVLIAYFVSQGNNRHPVYRKPKSNKKLDIEITSAIYRIAGNPKKQMDVSKTKTIAENGLVSFYE